MDFINIRNTTDIFLTDEILKHCRKMPDEYLNGESYTNYKNQDMYINLIYENDGVIKYYIVNWANFNVWYYTKSIEGLTAFWKNKRVQ